MRTRSPGRACTFASPSCRSNVRLQHVDELVLLRVDMQRHECARRIEGLEAEAARAVRFQKIAVAQHVPADLVLAGASGGDVGGQHQRSLRTTGAPARQAPGAVQRTILPVKRERGNRPSTDLASRVGA